MDPYNSHFALSSLRTSLLCLNFLFIPHISLYMAQCLLKKWMKCKFNTGDNKEMKGSIRIQPGRGCLKTQEHEENKSRQSSLIDTYKCLTQVGRCRLGPVQILETNAKQIFRFKCSFIPRSCWSSVWDSQCCHYSSCKLFNLPKLLFPHWQREDSHNSIYLIELQ